MVIRKISLVLLALTFVGLAFAEKSGSVTGIAFAIVEGLVILWYVVDCVIDFWVLAKTYSQVRHYLCLLLPILALALVIDLPSALVLAVVWLVGTAILLLLKAITLVRRVGSIHKAIGNLCSRLVGGFQN